MKIIKCKITHRQLERDQEVKLGSIQKKYWMIQLKIQKDFSKASVAQWRRVRQFIVRLSGWGDLCHIKVHATFPWKGFSFRWSDFVRLILPGFFFGRLMFISWVVAIIRIRRLVYVLIVLGAAVDSISAMVLLRNLITFGGYFIFCFPYFFVSYFFTTPSWSVSVLMTIVTKAGSFLFFLLVESPCFSVSFHSSYSMFLKF